MRLFNPTLCLELSKRQFIQIRESQNDTRALHFDAKTFDHYLLVGDHKASSVPLKAGRVVLIEGQHEHLLGVITYEEAWSEHGEKTLKEWESAYREQYGDYEQSPYGYLRHPATFEVKAWIPERTFEALLTANLEHMRICLFFTINPKEEGTIKTQSGLGSSELYINWNITKEGWLPAESFKVLIEPIEKKADPVPNVEPRKHSMQENEMFAKIRNIEKILIWCFLVLIFIVAVILFKKN